MPAQVKVGVVHGEKESESRTKTIYSSKEKQVDEKSNRHGLLIDKQRLAKRKAREQPNTESMRRHS